MIQSTADIANLALGKLGVRNWIVSLDDDTPEAQTVSVFYDNARDKVLRIYNWPFARRRAALALLPITRDGWDGAYMLPADCVAPRMIWGGIRNPSPSQIIPWVLENDATYRTVLLTDYESPILVYTARITAIATYPPLFVDAVASALALDMAFSITGRYEIRAAMLKEFRDAVSAAITAATGDEEPDEEPDSEFITGRV